MNQALLYRPNNRKLIATSFVCAMAIHVAAIAIAENKSKPAIEISWVEPEGPVDGFDPSPPPEYEPEILPPQPIILENQDFPEEVATQSPVRPRKKISQVPLTRSTGSGVTSWHGGSVKAITLYAPKPNYPYEARRSGITGSGIAQLTVNSAAGNVLDARMVRTTGNSILDNATVETLRRWRFKPGVASNVDVPITYELTGVSY